MKRFLDRFYLSFNFSYAIFVALLFFNNKSLVDNEGFLINFNFFIIFLSFIGLTTTLILFELKILYQGRWLLLLYAVLALMFPLFALLKGLETLRFILTGVILITLLVKGIICNNIQTSFKVEYFNFVPEMYLFILLTTIFINLTTTNYIASIFLLVPILMTELEYYIKLKTSDLFNNLRLIATFLIVLTTFFISYYGEINLTTTRLNFGTNIALPVISIVFTILLFRVINLRTKQIISNETIQ